MPIYTFVSEGGEVVEEIVPSKTTHITREGVDYKRSMGQEGFSLTGRAVGIPSQAEQVKDGYYKLEQKEGSRFLRQSQFSTKQIKNAWGF
tara:strand:- start:105 stop:374 length:270 start_codon:yes stop_codon:yes gene_type:complete